MFDLADSHAVVLEGRDESNPFSAATDGAVESILLNAGRQRLSSLTHSVPRHVVEIEHFIQDVWLLDILLEAFEEWLLPEQVDQISRVPELVAGELCQVLIDESAEWLPNAALRHQANRSI